jgi:hypothetical protein
VEGTRYRASVDAFYYGSEFYLSIYDVFEDVRLVGAPPSSIGKFGGDTDNWIWPRHTGDFAFFRIYSNRENLPSDILRIMSPLQVTRFSAGFHQGNQVRAILPWSSDFPGVTNQYLTSHAIRLITEFTNPHSIMLRDKTDWK